MISFYLTPLGQILPILLELPGVSFFFLDGIVANFTYSLVDLGVTPLHLALWNHGQTDIKAKSADKKVDSTQVVKTLLEAGANCHSEVCSGQLDC